MLESLTVKQVRTKLQAKDSERTGLVPWTEAEEALAEAGITLGEDSLQTVHHFFVTDSTLRYHELLRNLHSSLTPPIAWHVSRPISTFESRNLRESEGNTLGRKVESTPPPTSRQAVSVLGQLQSDKVDYMTLGLARENFQRLDKDSTGLLPAALFESCFRTRDLSPGTLQLLKLSSLDSSGKVAFKKFNQVIERYKYAPVRVTGQRTEWGDHAGLTRTVQEQVSPNKRVARNVEVLSERLKAKYRNAASAFRAFKRGEGVGLQQFSTEVANLGLDFSSDETQELFTHLSQGNTTLPFVLFNSAFEATSPRPVPPPLPRLALTPERFPQIHKRYVLPSDRSPTFAYGLLTKRGDNMEKLIHNDFVNDSPRRKPLKRGFKRGPVRLRTEVEAE